MLEVNRPKEDEVWRMKETGLGLKQYKEEEYFEIHKLYINSNVYYERRLPVCGVMLQYIAT